MKARIIGGIFVLAILGVVFVLTGGMEQTQSSSSSQTEQVAPSNPGQDDALKNLKIN